MSETRDLNSSGDSAADPERWLRDLMPQPLEVNRDDLFFRAGFAAGARSRSVSLAWPSAAAALLLVCLGLGTALVRQNIHSSSASPSLVAKEQTEMAAQAPLASTAWKNDQRSLDWLRSMSAATSPGKLTALGWIDSPPAKGIDHHESERKPNSSSPRQPPTYFELLRAYQEG